MNGPNTYMRDYIRHQIYILSISGVIKCFIYAINMYIESQDTSEPLTLDHFKNIFLTECSDTCDIDIQAEVCSEWQQGLKKIIIDRIDELESMSDDIVTEKISTDNIQKLFSDAIKVCQQKKIRITGTKALQNLADIGYNAAKVRILLPEVKSMGVMSKIRTQLNPLNWWRSRAGRKSRKRKSRKRKSRRKKSRRKKSRRR